MTARLSVVVPTYDRGHLVLRVLAPLLDDPAVEDLVVVVDGSPDDTAERLRALAARDPRVRPVVIANGGLAHARQVGLQHARHDVVLMLDDDVLASPGLASGHLAEHRRDPGRVVLGSMPTAPVVRRRSADVTTLLYEKSYERATSAYARDPRQVLEQFWAGNMSFPRDLALAVGMVTPGGAHLAVLEDHDLGLRLRAAGARAAYVPSLAATHLHTRTLPRFVQDSRRQGAAMQDLHRLHPDRVQEPTGRWIAGRLPPPARTLVTASARSPRAARAGLAGAAAAVRTTGALRLWPVQDVALVVLQRVAQADGARVWAESRA